MNTDATGHVEHPRDGWLYCCPECEASGVYRRATVKPPFRCNDCGAEFTTPGEREKQDPGVDGGNGEPWVYVSGDDPNVVLACPECDTCQIYRRDGATPPYRCKDGHRFDEPHPRPGRQRAGRPYTTTNVLIADLRRVCERFGRGVSPSEYDDHGQYSSGTITGRVGWANAVNRAGFEPVGPGPQGLGRKLHQMDPEDLGLSPLGERAD